MSKHSTEYNPLDYDNLTRNCVQELMTRGPFKIPIDEENANRGRAQHRAPCLTREEFIAEATRRRRAGLTVADPRTCDLAWRKPMHPAPREAVEGEMCLCGACRTRRAFAEAAS